MRLQELECATDHTLPSPSFLYRVQRTRARAGTLSIGPLRLAPLGLMASRFDVAGTPVGYFTDVAETALYESLARREATSVSLDAISKRDLLTLRATAFLTLLDLRPLASSWPVLLSLRYAETQELATEVYKAGYAGIVYRSAQQYDFDCVAIFGEDVLRTLRVEHKEALVDTGRLHRAAAEAIRRSKVPLVP